MIRKKRTGIFSGCLPERKEIPDDFEENAETEQERGIMSTGYS